MSSLLTLCSALLLVFGAVLFWRVARRPDEQQEVLDRLLRLDPEGQVRSVKKKRALSLGLRGELLARAGLRASRSFITFAIVSLLLGFALGYLWQSWRGGTLIVATLVVGGMVWLYARIRRYSEQVIAQLPAFLEHMNRLLGIGRTPGDAFRVAAAEAPIPLHDVLAPAHRIGEMGGDVPERLSLLAKLYRLEDLHLLSLVMTLSGRYGGDPHELMRGIIGMLEQRDRLRRQFKAMTGMTRLSALLAGLLPYFLAAYLWVMNPTYYMNALAEPAGRTMLLFAVFWSIAGGLVLWRMVRSI